MFQNIITFITLLACFIKNFLNLIFLDTFRNSVLKSPFIGLTLADRDFFFISGLVLVILVSN